MTRTLAAVAFCVASTLVTVGAQGDSSNGQKTPATQEQERELKVTGCLEKQPGSGETGGYMLTNVLGIGSREGLTGIGQGVGKTPPMGKPAVSPETADKDADMAHSAYRIGTVDSSVKLSDHVGHRVELSGRVTEQAPSAADASRSSTPSSASAAASTTAGDQNMPVLSVKSLRMVASSCR